MTPADAGRLRHEVHELMNRQRLATLADRNFTSYAARDAQARKLKQQRAKVYAMINSHITPDQSE